MWLRAMKKQTQFPKRPKMKANVFLTKNYENISDLTLGENNPNQSQNKPNFKPYPERSEFTLSVIEGIGPIPMPPNFIPSLMEKSKI